MGFRVRLGRGVTYGKTGLRFNERIGPVHISTGRSGTFLRASEGPITYTKTLRRGKTTPRPRRTAPQHQTADHQGERRFIFGMRRLWWVCTCLVAVGLLGSIPTVGMVLGTVVLIGMVVGLVLARPHGAST
jgi:hypothetical protein